MVLLILVARLRNLTYLKIHVFGSWFILSRPFLISLNPNSIGCVVLGCGGRGGGTIYTMSFSGLTTILVKSETLGICNDDWQYQTGKFVLLREEAKK